MKTEKIIFHKNPPADGKPQGDFLRKRATPGEVLPEPSETLIPLSAEPVEKREGFVCRK